MRFINLFLISFILVLCRVSHSEIHTTLIAEGFSLISPDYSETSDKTFSLVGASVRSDNTPTDAFKIDLTGEYAIGNSVLSYLNIREIYYKIEVGEKSSFEMGRKLMNWSSLDDLWNMGVFQPQFRWSRLGSQDQGLLGLFWNKNDTDFGLTLFASPMFIPDQGPSYEIRDGQFQSGNPMFIPPPQNVKFQNQILPIDYVINKPEVSDVIFQPEFGAQLRFGAESGYFADLSGVYKPSNQLALGYKGVLVTTRVRVDVQPKTYYENDYSAEVGYRGDWGFVQLSAMHNNPKNPEFDSSYNSPNFESSTMWGPQLMVNFKPFKFFFAYIDTVGGKITDVGPDASPDRSSLSERFLYRQAAMASVSYTDVFAKKVRVNSLVQFKYSPSEKYRELRFKNGVDIKGPWSIWMDLILIDTDSTVLSNMEPYKNLDQLWLGVGYDI